MKDELLGFLARFRLPLLGILIALIVAILWIRWEPKSNAERHHLAFIEAIENKRWGKCHRLLSKSYADDWGYDRELILAAIRDVGAQFHLSFEVHWTPREIQPLDRGGFAFVGTIAIEGQGTGLAPQVLREARAYGQSAFTFRWKRESWLPGSWKLQHIQNPDIRIPPGYQPGALRQYSF